MHEFTIAQTGWHGFTAHCRCGWTSGRFQLSGEAHFARDVVTRAALAHLEEARRSEANKAGASDVAST
jgi:hypothetical protein